MKKTSLIILLGAFFLLFTLFAAAQSKQSEGKLPKWISQKGFWVVESNVKTPLHATVYFYNNDKVLVYKETISGVRLNIERRKTQIRLNQVLEQSVAAWERDWIMRENQQLLASRIRK